MSCHRAEAVSVLFDGVLHDPPALRPPSDASRPSPAASIARAYQRTGRAVLAEIKGIYSLVLWDVKKGILVATRDVCGMYPLYYARSGETVYLSNAIQALVERADVSQDLDKGTLAQRLWRRWYIDAERTYFRSVRRVPPGHAATFTRNGASVDRDRDLVPGRGDRFRWIDGSQDEFEDLLGHAVGRYRLLGRAGVVLSGGADSASVAVAAARLAAREGEPVPLSVGYEYPGEDGNERDVQERIAAALGMEHIAVGIDRVGQGDGEIVSMQQMCRDWPSPPMNTWLAINQELYGAARQRGCGYLMSGHGGDEWLTTAPRLAADLMLRGDVAELHHLWRSIQHSTGCSARRAARFILWSSGVRALLGRVRARFRRQDRVPDWMSRECREMLRDELMPREREQRFETGTFYYDLVGECIAGSMDVLFREEDFELARRTGIYRARPYHDMDIVSFLMQVRPRTRNRGHERKALALGLIRKYVSMPEFQEYRKRIPRETFEERLETQLAAIWKMLGRPVAIGDHGLADVGMLDRAIARSFAPRTRDLFWLLHLSMVESWLRWCVWGARS